MAAPDKQKLGIHKCYDFLRSPPKALLQDLTRTILVRWVFFNTDNNISKGN